MGELGRRIGQSVLRAAPWVGLAALTAALLRRPAGERPGLSYRTPPATPPEAFDLVEPHRGRLAGSPLSIPPIGWRDVLWRTIREVGADKIPAVSGGVTYFGLLALFPAIGVFVSLYGLFADVGQVRRQLDQMALFVPPDILGLVGDQMARLAGSGGGSLSFAFVISLLLSVWSANAGMKSLFDGLNIAYDETERRGYFKRTLLTYGFTFAALVFLTLVAGLLVAVPLVLHWIDLPGLDSAWLPFRWLVLYVMAAAAWAVFYRYGPSREPPRWRWVVIGAAAAAAVWLAGSAGFSWYGAHIVHLDRTYGSLGAVIGFMLWIWFTVVIILTGAELNAEIEHQTAIDSTTGQPLPIGARGAAMADTVGKAFDLKGAADAAWARVPPGLRKRRQPNSSSRAASRAA